MEVENRAGQEYFECTKLQVQVLCTMKVLKYKYIPFWGNVLKYIPSTLKMYLSTIRSTFQLPSNFCTLRIKESFWHKSNLISKQQSYVYHFLKTYLFYKPTLLWQENYSDPGRFILWSRNQRTILTLPPVRVGIGGDPNRNRFWLMSMVESQSESCWMGIVMSGILNRGGVWFRFHTFM